MNKTTAIKDRKPLTVLSLFDGMSCGQIALRELGIPVETYYASEIDRHAMAQTMLNFPETVQLGDVAKWREWELDWSSVDLVLAGSPCQGFSFAGAMLAFDDPRSRLFFAFADILDHVKAANPEVMWMLENVRMEKRHEGVISERLGVQPVVINSALVSAQNRVRLYWSNIRTRAEGLFGDLYTDIPQPEDRGLALEDILEDEVDKKYYLSEKSLEGLRRHLEKGVYDLIKVRQLNPSKESNGCQPYQQNRVYDPSGKCPALMAEMSCGSPAVMRLAKNLRSRGGKASSFLATSHKGEYANGMSLVEDGFSVRRLTPAECARLQTIPDWYEWRCSETQRYRMLGNGWTVEVIKHILSFVNI